MINEKELTIGCHVLFDTWACKVDQINPPYINVSYKGHERCLHIEKLEPIPITKELLLKNGFVEESDDDCCEYIKKVDECWFTFRWGRSNMPNRDWYLHIGTSDRYTIGCCCVQCVHQAETLCNSLGVDLKLEL